MHEDEHVRGVRKAQSMSRDILDKPTESAATEQASAERQAHGAIVGSRSEIAAQTQTGTAGQALVAWWRQTVPGPVRRIGLQVLITVIVVLIVLPLASLAGLVSGRPSTTSSSQNNMSNMPGMTTTSSGASTAKVADHPLYDAQPAVAPTGDTVNVSLVAKPELLTIAPGVAYHAWTFNGTVPGPIIRVRQGQTVHFTLTNQDTMPHSIDFHAAQTAWNVNYQPVAPGKSLTFDWKADYPGVFMYHCGTPPPMVHIANGMYGAIIVDPASGWAPAQEYVLVQSEFYTQKMADGTYQLDGNAMMSAAPTYTVFNGYVAQYKDHPLTAKVGQKVRLFIMNAGPSHFSAFHIIGAIFSDYYVDGNPANHMVGNQTITVPPGGGAVVELTIPGAGAYPFVTHSFSDMDKGAVGVLKVE